MTRDYTYSPVGSIAEKVAEHGSYMYQYDDLQRLTEAVNPLADDEAYTYDLLGNRLTAANVPGTWNYNANNELNSYDNVSFNYDDNGNTTRKTIGIQETNYIYDVEDRLVQVENEIGSVIAKYYYDPLGRRLWKDVDSVRTYYLYSDEGLIGEYDQSGAEIRTYGYALNSTWTTDPLFVKSGSTYYWYQNDHAGTPQKIIDTSGRVVWSAVYDSFGNIQIETAEIINNLRFAGQYFDAETGLYYNLNRYYDPTTGRYLRTDPFGEGLNLYAYVFNDPVNWIDPLGLCKESSVLGKVQTGMDVAGTFDPTPIIDLLNAIIYAIRGEWGEASLSGIAAVPYIGDIFGKGGKLVKHGVKHADEFVDIVKASKKPRIKWDQNSQRWRDTATGQYTKGPKMPKGFGRPSTWKEGSKDVSKEMIATKEGQKAYEKLRDSSTQDDFAGAFEHALKELLKK